MTTNLLEPRKALNKAFLKIKPSRSHIESFKTNLIQLLDHCNEKETEEFHKNLVIDFLKKTYYDPNYYVNTKGRNDLVIHNGKDAKTNVGVIIEAKSPTNKSEMISAQNLNGKALQELVLYYMRERITHKNTELKHLVVTNIYEWFVFDAQLFNKLFAENKSFTKKFIDFEEGRLSGNKTEYFYAEIAKPFIEALKSEIAFAYFDIRKYDKQLRNADKEDDKSLVALFKLISPEHLLKLSFANDSNTLDKNFYSELLHIIGLTEIKEGGKKLIQRHKKGDRNPGSLLENAIVQLDSLDKISRLQNAKQYGETNDERLFTVALELTITWVNRILFLKLLEAQLITYHKGDRSYSFLNGELISDYDSLNSLFFQVLARKPDDRIERVKTPFAKVPYLNSSLFEPTDLEHETLFVSQLEDHLPLKLLSATVIKDAVGKKETGSKDSLNYFFSFLDAYDFASEGSEDIQEDNKTLINASVLGLIFEKINGYKDGSFFTPSFITMYMCKETIRRAVVQKFNETKNWNCTEFEQLYEKIEDRKEANAIINSLKICDPAVGSGHFLVSALNEIIAIKNDLRVLQDHSGTRLKEYQFEVVNDELIVTDEDGIPFSYNPKNKESQRIQETLFHEKQTIIENCLFGVDINPNSVKICRLRLWIELLKNAYYKFPSSGGVPEGRGGNELETLPNIDINIKCGNSLISRFALDADLKKALKQSKWNVESYKLAVDTYRNAESKEQKHEMERLIADIKGNFRSEIATNDPKKIKLEKLKGELFNLTQQTGLFERSKKEQTTWNKRVNTLAADTKKLDGEIEEIKSNKIYENAFEWRFEFPDVLNDNGDFVGFDVVIGNPPYKLIQPNNTSEAELKQFKLSFKFSDFKIDLFHLFYQLGDLILKEEGMLSFITPSSILNNVYAEGLRNLIDTNFIIQKIAISESKVFEDADVHTGIFQFKKSNKKTANKIELTTNLTGIINRTESYRTIDQADLNKLPGKIWNLLIDDTNISLINKIANNQTLKEIGIINRGLITGDRDKYFSTNKATEKHVEILSGSDINRYFFNKPSEFVFFERPKTSGGCWDNKMHFAPFKICIRQIGVRPTATLLNQPFAVTGNVFTVINKSENILKSILGIINSKCIQYYWKLMFSDFKTSFPQVTIFSLNQIPVPDLSKKQWIPIIELVEKILKEKTKNNLIDTSLLEQKIDAMVYELYGLSEEEIRIVENS